MPWNFTHETVRANVIGSKERTDKESRCKEKEGLMPILIGQKRRIGELVFLLGSRYEETMIKTLVLFFFSSRQEFSLSPRVSFLYALRGSLFFAFLILFTPLLAKPWSFLFLYTPLLVKPWYPTNLFLVLILGCFDT